MSESVIEVGNLHKSYGTTPVLRGVNLSIARGEAFGLLGPNGAGKSTLIHSILGMLKPNDGTITVLGTRVLEQIVSKIGYLPERTSYHLQFTAREYLRTLGSLSGLGGQKLHDRIEAVLDQVGIEDAADRRLGTYSKGMLQRFGLAQAILHEPDILIVDEPGSGLDPAGQGDMAKLLGDLRASGHTILLCTHQLTEAARLCDRVGVLVGGRLERVASLAELEAQGQSMTFKVQELSAELAHMFEDASPNIHCTRTTVALFPSTLELQNEVLQALLMHGVQIIAMTPAEDALEQFYLQAVHRAASPPAIPDGQSREELLETLVGGVKE